VILLTKRSVREETLFKKATRSKRCSTQKNKNCTKQKYLKSKKLLQRFFRLAQEGALMTVPFLGDRVATVTKKDLEVLLSFHDFDNPPAISLLEKDTQEQFNQVRKFGII
jgi:hypothetical protein